MIEVRVRHVNEADSVFLCNVEFGNQYKVIHDIEKNGGIYFKGECCSFNSHQYVMENGVAFFEIIVGEETDG